jgi:hypothetical protein
MNHSAETANTIEGAFAKGRYEYCLQLYEREQGRRETLERKAQFYLSLVTLFLGALVLKFDFLVEIRDLLMARTPSTLFMTLLYVSGGIFLIAIALALFGILMAVQVRGYILESPADLMSALFSSHPGYLSAYTEAELYTSVAKSYVLATESDRGVNNRKSRWVELTSYSIIAGILSFSLFYGLVAFLKLQ